MTTCLVVIDVLRSKAIGLAAFVITRAGYHAVGCLDAHRYLGCCKHPCHHISNTLSVIQHTQLTKPGYLFDPRGTLHVRHDTWEECIENALGARLILPRIILKIDSTIILNDTKHGKPT